MTDSEDIIEESRETLDYLHENNSQDEGGGGLPTAGVYAELVYYRDGEEVNRIPGTWLKESKLRSNAHYDDIQNLDELVRRFDVKALIQDKINSIIETEKMTDHEFSTTFYHAQERILRELLEELEQ